MKGGDSKNNVWLAKTIFFSNQKYLMTSCHHIIDSVNMKNKTYSFFSLLWNV